MGFMQVDTATISNSYFPLKGFLKLMDFNSSVSEDKRLEGSELSKLSFLKTETPSLGSVAALSYLLKSLPPLHTFPLLDLARLAVVNPRVSGEVVGSKEVLDQLHSCPELLDKTPCPFHAT